MQGEKIEAEMRQLTSAIHHEDNGEGMVTVFIFSQEICNFCTFMLKIDVYLHVTVLMHPYLSNGNDGFLTVLCFKYL
jgi:hypothetical protein